MALCSPAGEYFRKITLPPASVKISIGPLGESEARLVQAAALFFSRQMEG